MDALLGQGAENAKFQRPEQNTAEFQVPCMACEAMGNYNLYDSVLHSYCAIRVRVDRARVSATLR